MDYNDFRNIYNIILSKGIFIQRYFYPKVFYPKVNEVLFLVYTHLALVGLP